MDVHSDVIVGVSHILDLELRVDQLLDEGVGEKVDIGSRKKSSDPA